MSEQELFIEFNGGGIDEDFHTEPHHMILSSSPNEPSRI